MSSKETQLLALLEAIYRTDQSALAEIQGELAKCAQDAETKRAAIAALGAGLSDPVDLGHAEAYRPVLQAKLRVLMIEQAAIHARHAEAEDQLRQSFGRMEALKSALKTRQA